MKLGFSQQQIIDTAKSLGLPSDGFIQRRVARAFDLVESNKVTEVDDGIFRVRSQYDASKAYIVNVNHGQPSCDCPDGERTVNCKHRIASLLYANRRVSNADDNRKQSQAITCVKTTDGNEGDYWRRCWLIAQGNRRTLVYEEPDGRLFCTCGAYYNDCIHKQLVIKTVKSQLRFINECGTEQAKSRQDKLNGQLDSQGNKGNGAENVPSLTGGLSTADVGLSPTITTITTPTKLDLRDPFQESEQLDIDQIEGRRNGELAWKLSNGKYCISYKGIMRLAEKHAITFTDGDNSLTSQVIARARLNGSERISGKLPIPSRATALELAKRNAARQLISLPEIKALEHKVKLEAEFDWQKAYAKCVELLSSALKDTPVVGIEANVDIIIHELVKDGKLRQDTPSHYDRTEWLIIHNACKQDAQQQTNDNDNDGGDKTPSSQHDDEVNRYKVLADAPVNENWLQRHRECTQLVGFPETDLIISQELNFRYTYYKNKITNEQWDIVQTECRYRWNARQAQAEFASAQQAYKFKHIRDISGYDVKSKQFVGRPPLNSKDFVEKCKEAIEKVRAENKVEANDQPLEGNNGKRQLQMDKKLRTWLIEADGTKKEISCREICEQFESKSPTLRGRRPGGQNPSIVTRLRACIDDGADIGIVELDD